MSLFTRLFRRSAKASSSVDRGDPTRVAEVDALLDEMRGTFAADGGDVRLAYVRAGVVGLELHGACAGCAASAMTLELAIRPKLRANCAWFERLERV